MENIESIKRALGASKMIYDAVRANLREGVSEREIYDLVGKTAGELLRDQQWEYIGDFVSGERTAEIGGDATDRKMKPGDLFILDLSLRCADGWCDTCRTFFLGEPSEEIRRAYDTVLRCQRVGELAVRPGVKASDIKLEYMLANPRNTGLKDCNLAQIRGRYKEKEKERVSAPSEGKPFVPHTGRSSTTRARRARRTWAFT